MRRRLHISNRMVLAGFALAALSWLLASVLDFFLIRNSSLLDQIAHPETSQLYMRLVVVCLFLIFGSHAQYIMDQRRQTEEALRESEEKHRSIIEAIHEGYYEIDLEGNFTFFNDSMCRITGYTARELAAFNARNLMDAETAETIFSLFRTVYDTGAPVRTFEAVLIRKDSERSPVESSVSLIRSPDGNALGFRGLLRDITQRKKEEALRQEKMAAEVASRAKSEFLANMSHEIRTPLNSIIGLIELVLDTDLNPDQREDLDVVLSAAYALLSVINDILDFSKIEAGKLELEHTAFDLRDFLGDSLRIMAARADDKGLELAYRVLPDIPDRLIGDSTRFRQIILNLVGNAVKFTDSGEIIVTVERCEQEAAGPCLHFSVRDTGIGIPPEKQKNIFNAFEQADGTTARRFGGTGLGLAISSQLVAMMGGKIWLESRPGEGSVFHFTATFNLDPNAEDMFDLLSDFNVAGIRVLVVDDNLTHLSILREMFESWKMIPVTVPDAEAAKTAFTRSGETGTPFELAVIDSDMPASDGFALGRWIEEQQHCPVIMMLTASSRRSRQESAAQGKAFITKPVRPSDLLDAVLLTRDRTSPVRKKAVHPSRPVPEAFNRSLHILVAEDTPFNQKYITRLLNRWGHRPAVVENGRKAVEALRTQSFDLVLMDVQMPEMDGLTATTTIRTEEAGTGNHIPIIAMTAHAMKGDRERCLAAGMDDYVSKPISSDALSKAIRKNLSTPAPAGAPSESAPVAETPSGETAPPEPVFLPERNLLLKGFDSDWEFFTEGVALFMEEYPQMLSEIQAHIQRQDADGLRQTAHAFKGMLGNFQATEVARTAYRLESSGRANDLDDAESVYETLVRQTELFREQLTAFVRKEYK